MKILAGKAVNSRYLFYKEITEEFEKTLLQALLEKHDHNVLKMSASVKLHRNTIAKKIEKAEDQGKESQGQVKSAKSAGCPCGFALLNIGPVGWKLLRIRIR